MDSMVWVEQKFEDWKLENPDWSFTIYGDHPVLAIDNEGNNCCIISNHDIGFYKPTYILVKKPLSEVIKEKMPTEEWIISESWKQIGSDRQKGFRKGARAFEDKLLGQ